MKKRPLLIFTLILIIALAFFLALQFKYSSNSLTRPSTSVTHAIILEEGGFSQKEITINQGDTINFTTSLNQPFWPASDLHPTHGIYPEFDPLEPLDADTSWKFTFHKKGSWKYHDHLSPQYRGIIHVN